MEHIISWSGGKDSTATVILAHMHQKPVDLIIFSEVMFDQETSGELPEHMDFVRNSAIPKFREWGYSIEILHAGLAYMDIFMREPVKGKNVGKGLKTGFPMSGRCQINKSIKVKAIHDFYKKLKEDYVEYVGIAADESERLARLDSQPSKISLLAKYGYTEQMAADLCRQHGLMSPVYKFSLRGGCWFCPNARKSQMKHLRENYPELWEKLLRLEEEPGLIGNIWNTLSRKSIHQMEEQFFWESLQMDLFSCMEGREV